MKRRPVMQSAAEALRATRSALDYLHASMPEGSVDPMADFQPRPKRAANTKVRTCPTEDQEQAAVIQWWHLAHHGYGIPEAALFSIPNGGTRHMLEAVKMKRTGTRPGVPDLMLAVVVQDFAGCFIELKAIDGRLSPEQDAMLHYLRTHGYNALCAYGFLEAKRIIEAYLARMK